jgi:hypothetical protein
MVGCFQFFLSLVKLLKKVLIKEKIQKKIKRIAINLNYK